MTRRLSLLFLLPFVRTQKYGSDEPLVIPVKGPQAQFPALITADNFPLFPFTDQFNTGVEINPANKVSVAGDMIIPVPGWGNFDVDGNVYFGHINVDAKVGYQIRPTNKLNIKPETLALLNQNPAFREARKKAKEVVVGRIPYGYEPIKCKPPYCNPFVHNAGVAVEVEQASSSKRGYRRLFLLLRNGEIPAFAVEKLISPYMKSYLGPMKVVGADLKCVRRPDGTYRYTYTLTAEPARARDR